MKICSTCKRGLPKENFHKNKNRKDGLVGSCKDCIKAYVDPNRDKMQEYYKQYYLENKNIIQEYSKQYRDDNTEKAATYAKKYKKNNREKYNLYNHRYRSLKQGLPNTLTLEQWDNVKEYFSNQCAYCGENKPLAQEHVVALSKGGEYTHNNIVPACKSCNSSKGVKDFFDFYPTCKHYSKEREAKILKFLNYENGNQQLKII